MCRLGWWLILSSEARTPTPIRNPRIRKQSILAAAVYVEKSSRYSTAECSYSSAESNYWYSGKHLSSTADSSFGTAESICHLSTARGNTAESSFAIAEIISSTAENIYTVQQRAAKVCTIESSYSTVHQRMHFFPIFN